MLKVRERAWKKKAIAAVLMRKADPLNLDPIRNKIHRDVKGGWLFFYHLLTLLYLLWIALGSRCLELKAHEKSYPSTFLPPCSSLKSLTT
jgi:hypothetical protein